MFTTTYIRPHTRRSLFCFFNSWFTQSDLALNKTTAITKDHGRFIRNLLLKNMDVFEPGIYCHHANLSPVIFHNRDITEIPCNLASESISSGKKSLYNAAHRHGLPFAHYRNVRNQIFLLSEPGYLTNRSSHIPPCNHNGIHT